MKSRLGKVIRGAAVIIGIGAAYALFVHFTGWGIPCVFHEITGLKCPGCGVTHMAMALIRFDFKAAFEYNRAIFCLLPLMLFTAAREIYLYVRYGKRNDRTTKISTCIMAAVLLSFGVIRNVV